MLDRLSAPMPEHDARGQPLAARTFGRRMKGVTGEAVAFAFIFLLLLFSVASSIAGVVLHVQALLTLGSVPGTLAVSVYLSAVVVLLWVLYRSMVEQRELATYKRGLAATGPMTHCSACDYPLDRSLPQQEDNCRLCPECGAAWRETSASPPVWIARTRGWVRDARSVLVPLQRDKTDAEFLDALRLPQSQTYTYLFRWSKLIVSVAILGTGFTVYGTSLSPLSNIIFAFVTAGVLLTCAAALSHQRLAVRRQRAALLAANRCPHCEQQIAQDSLGNQHCPHCKCEW